MQKREITQRTILNSLGLSFPYWTFTEGEFFQGGQIKVEDLMQWCAGVLKEVGPSAYLQIETRNIEYGGPLDFAVGYLRMETDKEFEFRKAKLLELERQRAKREEERKAQKLAWKRNEDKKFEGRLKRLSKKRKAELIAEWTRDNETET